MDEPAAAADTPAEDLSAASVQQDAALAAVAAITGHQFADVQLLLQGLTHASTSSGQTAPEERLAQHNERLEFLGDALLGAAVADILYQRFPAANEGFLSRCKSRLVSRKTLAGAIDHHQLMEHAILGPQMSSSVPVSVRANIAEGLLGALYRDGGWQALRQGVLGLLQQELAQLDEQPIFDAKNALQMWCLEHHGALPRYEHQRSGGSDHAPRFMATVSINDHCAQGEGGSRRSAEFAAAAALLSQLQAAATGSAEAAGENS